MKELGKRLRTLREGVMLSQVKLAEMLGTTQSSLNRYENGQSTPSVALLRKYADYFDVSMDYIFARCDEPQGKLYQFESKKSIIELAFQSSKKHGISTRGLLLWILQQLLYPMALLSEKEMAVICLNGRLT